MLSNSLREKRNQEYVLGEIFEFSNTHGNGSWQAYQTYMKTGSWEKTRTSQSFSTLEVDFAEEDHQYLERVSPDNTDYQEKDYEIGYYDQEYEEYSEEYIVDEDASQYGSDTDSQPSCEDEYLSS